MWSHTQNIIHAAVMFNIFGKNVNSITHIFRRLWLHTHNTHTHFPRSLPLLFPSVKMFSLAPAVREEEERLTDWHEFLSAPQISWNHGPPARLRPDTTHPDQLPSSEQITERSSFYEMVRPKVAFSSSFLPLLWKRMEMLNSSHLSPSAKSDFFLFFFFFMSRCREVSPCSFCWPWLSVTRR